MMSGTSIAALFVIQFIYGWNQYLSAAADHDQGELLHRGHDRVAPEATVVDTVPENGTC